MPKVVIEIQASTQQAVTQIQQFAKAQRDAFDAVKSGSGTLQDATIKVSKLTENVKEMGAAHRAARAGIGELTSSLGPFGGVLEHLTRGMSGFSLSLLGLAGAGVGFIRWLQSVSDEATKTTNAVTALAKDIESDLKVAILDIQQISLKALGDQFGALAAGAGSAVEKLKKAREDALDAAREAEQKAQPGIGTKVADFFMAIPLALSGTQSLGESAQMQASAARRAAEAKADATYALQLKQIQTQQKADQIKLYEDEIKDFQQKEDEKLKKAQEAADAQKKMLHDLTASAADMFKDFPGAEELTKNLDLAGFAQKTQDQIEQYQKAIEAGADSTGLYAKAIEFLKKTLDEVQKSGVIPSIAEETKKKEAADRAAAEAAKKAADAEREKAEAIKKATEALKDVGADAKKAADERGLAEEKATLKRIDLEKQYAVESATIEEAAMQEKIKIFEALTGDAKKAAEFRVQVEQTALDKIVKAEIDAAEKRKAAMAELTESVKGIVEGLGEGFGAIARKLELSSFVQSASKSLELLTQNKDALAKMGLSASDVTRLTDTLTRQIQQAIQTGYIPQKKAIEDVTAATQASTQALQENIKAADYMLGKGPPIRDLAGNIVTTLTTMGMPGQGGLLAVNAMNAQRTQDEIARRAEHRISAGASINTVINVTGPADPEETARRIVPIIRQYAARGML